MQDEQIIELYWTRSQQAIQETFSATARMLKNASTTPIFAPGTPFRPHAPRPFKPG